MDDKQLLHCQQIATRLATEAGNMILLASGRSKNVEEKESRTDLVTDTDKAVEEFLFTQFRKHFPEHRFIGEESSVKEPLTDVPTWIIDPVDGTMNFIHSFPFVCVSIGLTVNKIPVLGVVFSPFLKKLYTARKGAGARCNGQPIGVNNKCKSLKEALLMLEFGPTVNKVKLDAVKRNLTALGWMCHGIRNAGSAALNLCMLAEGFADAYFDFGLHVWDITAGIVVLTEAGGLVMDTDGGPIDILGQRILAASNQTLAMELSKNIVVHPRLGRD